MSRVGKLPISIPDGVEITVDSDNRVTAKGPKGELTAQIPPQIKVSIKDGVVTAERDSEAKLSRSMHGLSRSLIWNIVQGITEGYQKKLQVVGVGFRSELRGKSLLLNIGYSHPILFTPPDGIEIGVDSKANEITVSGIDKQLVGVVAAKIRAFKKPEPYKGKGIRYIDETVRRKAGKTAA